MRRPNFESEFKSEYTRLNGLDARHIVAGTPKGEAQKWTPAKLNRYGNILPYDRNRVVLKDADGEGTMENCNYINASWMRKVMKECKSNIVIDTQYYEQFAGDSGQVEKGSTLRRRDPPKRRASNSGR